MDGLSLDADTVVVGELEDADGELEEVESLDVKSEGESGTKLMDPR